MSADPSSQASSSPDGSSSAGRGGLYLDSRTKVAILAVCMVLMVAVSVYAVLQPLNPDPARLSLSAQFWYPHETNPYARLPFVDCAQDKSEGYGCRLNSIAVNAPDVGSAEGLSARASEVWAVGNFGLALHRPAGQFKWEQLKVTAQAAPPPTETTTPPPVQRSVPTQATPASPEPKPTQTTSANAATLVKVPSLVGLGLEEAKVVIGTVLELKVMYEPGAAPSQSQQNQQVQQAPAQQPPSAPKVLVILRQSPAAGTMVARGTVVSVVAGYPPKAAAGLLLNYLVPTVYAAENDKTPNRTRLSRATSLGEAPSRANTSSAASQAPPPLPLDDDLIYVNCSNQTCRALGRSGRIYNVTGAAWTYKQARFSVPGSVAGELSLVSATNSGKIIAKVHDSAYLCSLPTDSQSLDKDAVFRCSAWADGTVKGDQVVDSHDQLADGSAILQNGTFLSSNNSSERLLVGENGFIGRSPSPSGGVTVVPAHTTAALRAFAFHRRDGYIAGDYGLILSTSDSGDIWRHEMRGPEGAAPDHRLPAPWYWVAAFLLVLTCAFVVATPPPPPATEFSVADWTVTDAPLKPGDVDSLDFTPMALGLSRFIRNPKTQPPVTIAIEGEWGEGKSSVMSLLRGDLEKSRYRPVWFNAWHHQSEEQLLAALLQHIKDQAVPPWWHIDNWIFRVRLLHYRLRDKWPLMAGLTLALLGSISYEVSHHGVSLQDIKAFGAEMVDVVRYFLPWSKQNHLPEDIGHYSVVVTVLAVLAAVLKQARAFGIDPSKLSDNLRDAATIKNVKPDPGVRPRFAREFGDLCDAWSWGGRRVIIFIDDLDRCRPESVVTVLESINFLTTAGDCIIVLGMAREQVTHAVGLGFKEIAEAEAAYKGVSVTEQQKAEARFNYGAFYIKKLVNIMAPLPKTTPDQRRRVLEAKAAELRRHEEEQQATESLWRVRLWESLAQAGRMTAMIAPVVALLGAFAASVVIGYQKGIVQTAALQNTADKNVGLKTTPNVTQPAASPSDSDKPLLFQRPDTKLGILSNSVAGAQGTGWSYGVDALFLLALFGILAYQLSARTNQDAQNSPEFQDSLKLWGQYIVMVCDTPREIKRALNDLRYQAMTRRSNGPSSTRGERLMRILRERVTGRSEPAAVAKRVDESALPPLKAAELAKLSGQELERFLDAESKDLSGSENLKLLLELKVKHIGQFHRWMQAAPEAAPEAQAAGSVELNPADSVRIHPKVRNSAR
jgi:hypothetical protein